MTLAAASGNASVARGQVLKIWGNPTVIPAKAGIHEL
jgi:hypothetical protein